MRHLFLLLAGLLLCVQSAQAADADNLMEAKRIRIGVCLAAEPVGFRDTNGQPRGYDVDVATLLAESLGAELELVETTVPTRIPDLLGGQFDVIGCNLTATPERGRSVDLSFPYLRTGLKLIVRRDSGVAGFDDLGAGKRIAVGRGTTGERLAEERAPKAELVYITSPGDALLLMRQGRAEAYVNDSLIVDYMAKANPDPVVVLDGIYTVDAIAFGVRKGNPEFLRWLDLFASTYVSSGQYARTYAKWWGGAPPPLQPIW